jgi:lycopene cyclase domain-containing protein
MTWPRFCLGYAIVALFCLWLCRGRLGGQRRLAARTLAAVTLMVSIFDGVAESRLIWSFPKTIGVYLLDVPIENILLIFASATNSLLFSLLFGDHLLSIKLTIEYVSPAAARTKARTSINQRSSSIGAIRISGLGLKEKSGSSVCTTG